MCSALPDKVHPDVQAQVASAGDMKGAVIARNQKTCELCAMTMEIFATAYGAESGVAALKFLPMGGLFLTGGLTPKNIDLIAQPDGPFLRAFLDKGRVSGLLRDIPLYAVMVEDIGMRGARLVAANDLRSLPVPRQPVEEEDPKPEPSRFPLPPQEVLTATVATAVLLVVSFVVGSRR